MNRLPIWIDFDDGLAFDGALVVSAMCEFIEALDQEESDELIKSLMIFQKRLKYGLPTESTIALYKLGFSDRVIAQDLDDLLNLSATTNKDLVKALKENRDAAINLIKKYPAYSQKRMHELLQ